MRNPAQGAATLVSEIVLTSAVLVGLVMIPVFVVRGVLLGYGVVLDTLGWR